MSHTSGYYHTDDPRTIQWLANVLQQAVVNERSVRLHVVNVGEGEPRLMVKVGGGWTSPIDGTPDISRDRSL